MKKNYIALRTLFWIALSAVPLVIFAVIMKDKNSGPLLLFAAVVVFLSFFIYQYIILIQHCRHQYLGNYKKRWLFFLISEPFGLCRIIYFRNHFRPCAKQSGRYAYSDRIFYRKLGDLKLNIFSPAPFEKAGYTCRAAPINESPIYRYLETGNPGIFMDYHAGGLRKGCRIKHPDSCSLRKFNRLYGKIKKNGYDYSKPYIRVKGDLISDGAHRVCILYRLHGPEFQVGVVLNKELM